METRSGQNNKSHLGHMEKKAANGQEQSATYSPKAINITAPLLLR